AASTLLMPAHRAHPPAVAGPSMCRYRRASSRRAVSGSTEGGAVDHTTGSRAPSHLIRMVPVAPAILIWFGWGSPAARAASPAGQRCIEVPGLHPATKDLGAIDLEWGRAS